MKQKWIIFSVLAIILIAGVTFVAKQYYHYAVSNFKSYDGEAHSYHVYPGMTADSVLHTITADYEILSQLAWTMQCHYMQYTQPKPGNYRFSAEISNKELIRRLQLGEQSPIKLSFTQAIRTREQLAGHMGRKLQLDSAEVIQRLNDSEYLEHFGLTPETAVCLFIPNTYEVYWTMSADQLFARMYKEYNRFGTSSALPKQRNLGSPPWKWLLLLLLSHLRPTKRTNTLRLLLSILTDYVRGLLCKHALRSFLPLVISLFVVC
jgi:UPF0755 protein